MVRPPTHSTQCAHPPCRWIDRLGTIDYVKKGQVIFRTDPAERDRLIFQLGTADPELALKAALTMYVRMCGWRCAYL